MKSEAAPRLIVGLGNPGPEYENTRHNVGFKVIDRLVEILPGQGSDPRHFADSHIWQRSAAGGAVLLQKPLTMMNLSGAAVAKLSRESGIAPHEILIISDDADLPWGRLRLRQQGGSGGHRGIGSILERLGSDRCARLRIGIGREEGDGLKEYVLAPFSEGEQQELNIIIGKASEAVNLSLRRGLGAAMNAYNGLSLIAEEEAKDENGKQSE